jgi:hypothetical protein
MPLMIKVHDDNDVDHIFVTKLIELSAECVSYKLVSVDNSKEFIQLKIHDMTKTFCGVDATKNRFSIDPTLTDPCITIDDIKNPKKVMLKIEKVISYWTAMMCHIIKDVIKCIKSYMSSNSTKKYCVPCERSSQCIALLNKDLFKTQTKYSNAVILNMFNYNLTDLNKSNDIMSDVIDICKLLNSKIIQPIITTPTTKFIPTRPNVSLNKILENSTKTHGIKYIQLSN